MHSEIFEYLSKNKDRNALPLPLITLKINYFLVYSKVASSTSASLDARQFFAKGLFVRSESMSESRLHRKEKWLSNIKYSRTTVKVLLMTLAQIPWCRCSLTGYPDAGRDYSQFIKVNQAYALAWIES